MGRTYGAHVGVRRYLFGCIFLLLRRWRVAVLPRHLVSSRKKFFFFVYCRYSQQYFPAGYPHHPLQGSCSFPTASLFPVTPLPYLRQPCVLPFCQRAQLPRPARIAPPPRPNGAEMEEHGAKTSESVTPMGIPPSDVKHM